MMRAGRVGECHNGALSEMVQTEVTIDDRREHRPEARRWLREWKRLREIAQLLDPELTSHKKESD